jgi:hypothetical protein
MAHDSRLDANLLGDRPRTAPGRRKKHDPRSLQISRCIVTGDRQRASSTSRSLRESRTALASGIIPTLNHDSLSFESRY